MEPAFRKHGKIAHGMQGSGTVTQSMVEQRAKELAAINGREAFNENDLDAARIELLGLEDQDDFPEDDLVGSGRTNENPGSTGTPAVRIYPRDEQAEAEKLVQDGLDEAQHTTMREGVRTPRNQE